MLSTWPTGSWQGASGNLMCLDPQSKEVAEVSFVTWNVEVIFISMA